jgi:hypothetical protein
MKQHAITVAALGAVITGLASVHARKLEISNGVFKGVSVSPTSVVLSSRDRTGSLELYNGDDSPTEVELSLAFGYPVSDSLGRVDVPLTEHPASGEPSAVDWLRIYPRRLVLQPGQQQLVRIAAYPPDLGPGEYWARLIVRLHAAPNPVDVPGGTATPRSLASIQTMFVTAVNYRNGIVTTGVNVDHAAARRTDSTIALTLDLTRTGNAAFVGRLELAMRDAGGAVIDRTSENLAVYRHLRRVITLHPPTSARVATVSYRLSTQRDDVPRELLVRADAREGRVPIDR